MDTTSTLPMGTNWTNESFDGDQSDRSCATLGQLAHELGMRDLAHLLPDSETIAHLVTHLCLDVGLGHLSSNDQPLAVSLRVIGLLARRFPEITNPLIAPMLDLIPVPTASVR